MGILADWQIEEQVKITPRARGLKRRGKISFGVTSYGYDLRLGDEYRIFSNANGATVVDPKKFDESAFVKHKGKYCIIPPNSFVLAESFETLEIPRDIQTICVGKSTYARCGFIVNVTPLEPEWIGKVTIEISNSTPLPVKVYSHEGILQVLFFRADGVDQTAVGLLELYLREWAQDTMAPEFPTKEQFDAKIREALCKTSYADKKGKYQNQTGLTLPTVDGKNQNKKR